MNMVIDALEHDDDDVYAIKPNDDHTADALEPYDDDTDALKRVDC